MNIDRRSLVAEVAASELVERLEAGLAAQGLALGPLGGADPRSTLGDALLARAGRRSLKYGELWDRVLSLEAELPGGRSVRAGGAPRSATGPDVGRTLLEARGGLGRVLRAWLRLHPAPPERLTLRADFGGVVPAVAALAAVVRSGARPAEVALSGSGDEAELLLLFEGEAGLAGAEAARSRRTLEREGLTVTPGPSVLPALPVDSAAQVIIEDLWSRLPARLEETLAAAGGAAPAPARLAWVGHEGAGLALPWPEGRDKPPVDEPPARALLAHLARALERRCT